MGSSRHLQHHHEGGHIHKWTFAGEAAPSAGKMLRWQDVVLQLEFDAALGGSVMDASGQLRKNVNDQLEDIHRRLFCLGMSTLSPVMDESHGHCEYNG